MVQNVKIAAYLDRLHLTAFIAHLNGSRKHRFIHCLIQKYVVILQTKIVFLPTKKITNIVNNYIYKAFINHKRTQVPCIFRYELSSSASNFNRAGAEG